MTVHRGTTDPLKNCIELNSQPVGLERINKTIYVGTMDESLHCYTSKVSHLFCLVAFCLLWHDNLPMDVIFIVNLLHYHSCNSISLCRNIPFFYSFYKKYIAFLQNLFCFVSIAILKDIVVKNSLI